MWCQKNYVPFSDKRTMAFDQIATEGGCDAKNIIYRVSPK